MDKEKTMQTLDDLISKLDGAAGRLIVTAMGGNSEVKEAMEMISSVSLQLGLMAEEFEQIFDQSAGEDPDLDWTAAEEYLDELMEAYREIGPPGVFGLTFLTTYKTRLDNGERTPDLYKEIMESQ